MYSFIDTIDRSNTETVLPAEAVSIDGMYLENAVAGYRTLYVKGRESLGVEVDSYSVATTDGETVKGLRYPTRTLTVGFQLIAPTNESFREAFNQLNNLLSLEEADFVFNDERDKFFCGVPIFNADVPYGRNSITAEWEIFCSYPFKRSVEPVTISSEDYDPESDLVTKGDHAVTFLFEYKGTQPARPQLVAEFAGALSGGDHSDDGDCGFVAFMDEDENIIQLGNPEVIDTDEYSMAAQLINRTFSTISDWSTSGGAAYGGKAITGSVAVGNITDAYWAQGKGLTAPLAGPSAYGSGNGWHGPVLRYSTEGAINFSLALVHRLAASDAGQCGSFECGAYDSSNKMIAGFVIEKGGSGTNGIVRYILNGKQAGTDSIDLSYYNTHFGYCNRTAVYGTETYYEPVTQSYQVRVCVRKKTKKKKAKYKTVTKYKTVMVAKIRPVQNGWSYTQSNLNSTMDKSGSAVTFKVGNLPARTFRDGDIELTPSQTVSMHFGQYGSTAALHTNAVHSVKFTRQPATAFAEIPNVFTAGDIVEADCNDATVYLSRENSLGGQLVPQYGALGNNWEDFMIVAGMNRITAIWSDWVKEGYDPVIKLVYNEVYI